MMLDTLGRRYGKTPAELLDSDLETFMINLMCYQEADAMSEALVKKMVANGIPVFPAAIVRY